MGIQIRLRQPADASQITAREHQLGVAIPSPYRTLLELTDGGVPLQNYFSPDIGINQFLGLEEIVKWRQLLGDRLPRSMVPIAKAAGGNLVCLSTGEEPAGVYFWDHELEDAPGGPFSKIAPSFDQFINRLQEFPAGLETPAVLSVKADPDFLRQEIQKQAVERSGVVVVWPPADS